MRSYTHLVGKAKYWVQPCSQNLKFQKGHLPWKYPHRGLDWSIDAEFDSHLVKLQRKRRFEEKILIPSSVISAADFSFTCWAQLGKVYMWPSYLLINLRTSEWVCSSTSATVTSRSYHCTQSPWKIYDHSTSQEKIKYREKWVTWAMISLTTLSISTQAQMKVFTGCIIIAHGLCATLGLGKVCAKFRR